MMFGSGDEAAPYQESIDLMDDLATQFIEDLVRSGSCYRRFWKFRERCYLYVCTYVCMYIHIISYRKNCMLILCWYSFPLLIWTGEWFEDTYQVCAAMAVTTKRKGGFKLDDICYVLRNDRKKLARAKVWIVSSSSTNVYCWSLCSNWTRPKSRSRSGSSKHLRKRRKPTMINRLAIPQSCQETTIGPVCHKFVNC